MRLAIRKRSPASAPHHFQPAVKITHKVFACPHRFAPLPHAAPLHRLPAHKWQAGKDLRSFPPALALDRSHNNTFSRSINKMNGSLRYWRREARKAACGYMRVFVHHRLPVNGFAAALPVVFSFHWQRHRYKSLPRWKKAGSDRQGYGASNALSARSSCRSPPMRKPAHFYLLS